ncbi:MAG: PKD domain-containing protein, partial [Flavobacteriales bacterium]|nr:PKD domain-containing protein [Flavobacteriales bacterium]
MKSLLITSIALATLQFSALAHKPVRLEFIHNAGQWEEQVRFKAPMWNGAVFLEEDGITYNFYNPEDWKKTHDLSQLTWEQQKAFSMRGHAWRVKFVGAQTSNMTGDEKLNHYYNYRIGNDASKWKSKVGVFHAVEYGGVYPGIDLRAYDNQSASFKYDFIVHPGSEPNNIALQYSGLDEMFLQNGQLLLRTSVGDFIEQQPFAYQVINGKIVEIACNYVLKGNVLSFDFPKGYDTSIDLVIDPTLIAATLSGSTSTNYGHTATYDIAGNIYTGCISFGVGYPTTDGAYQESYAGGGWAVDMAFSKLTPDGTDLLWASYLGGAGGDYPSSLYANDFGELFIYGSSDSNDIPVSSNAYQDDNGGAVDIVLAHFFEDGTDVFGCTYLGGSGQDGRNQASVNYGDQYRGEIILDNSGNPMIASFSTSSNFPVTAGAYQNSNNGSQDAVVFRMNTDLSNLLASTYIGSDSDDSGFALRQNAAGDIYLAGMAGDDNFPTTPGAYSSTYLGDADAWGAAMDGFVSKFNTNLTSLLASTYFATDDQDEIFFLDLDNNEDVYIYGQGGADIPVVGTVYSNPGSLQFVSKLSADLTTLMLSTQIGTGGTGWGGFDFVPIAFLVDHCNNVYISGHGCYGEVPLTSDALYNVGEGGFYLAVFNENMENLEYGTMYTSGHVDGGTSRFDKNGTVYQGVCSGGDFATTSDAWATDQLGGWDIGVFKIDFDVSGVNSAITGSDVNGCAPFEVQFSNYSTGDTFFWDFGDGFTSTEYEPTHIYTEPGAYQVSLVATDSLSCNIADTSFFDINISTPIDYFPDFTYTTDCATLGINCTNTTGYDFLDYVWD